MQLELSRDVKLDISDRDGGYLECGCGGRHATVEPTRGELDEDGSGEILRLAVHRVPCPFAQVSEHSECLPALAAAAFLVAGRGPRGHVEAFIGHAHPLCHILQNQLGDLAVGARGSRNGECHLERHLGHRRVLCAYHSQLFLSAAHLRHRLLAHAVRDLGISSRDAVAEQFGAPPLESRRFDPNE